MYIRCISVFERMSGFGDGERSGLSDIACRVFVPGRANRANSDGLQGVLLVDFGNETSECKHARLHVT